MPTVIGKIEFIKVTIGYFLDIQGKDGKDIFDRFPTLENIIKKEIDEPYRDFIAYPVKESGEVIFFGGKYVKDTPKPLTELQESDRDKYKKILDDTLTYYQSRIKELDLSGKKIEAEYLKKAIKYVEDRFVYCYDGQVLLAVWGMKMRDHIRESDGVYRYDLSPVRSNGFKIIFDAGESGIIESGAEITKEFNQQISAEEIPDVKPNEGFEFIGWDANPVNYKIKDDKKFTAQYQREKIVLSPEPPAPQAYRISFNAGNNGVLEGEDSLTKTEGEKIDEAEIPIITSQKDYEFIGWDENPVAYQVHGNKVFVAQYRKVEKGIPWYKQWWAWITDRGCLKWLLWLLLLALLIFVLTRMDGCNGCNPIIDSHDNTTDITTLPSEEQDSLYLEEDPRSDNDSEWQREDPRVRDDGGVYDPNNPYTPIPTPEEDRAFLPPSEGVLEPIKDDPEVIPGNPAIIADRLNILMENEDKSIRDFAKAFKEKYQEDKYEVIYYDNVVKRLQILVPKEEREQLKTEIPGKFKPDYTLFVFDESLFIGQRVPNDPGLSDSKKNKYLKAVKAFEAWDITMGSTDVVVAIVDNGFNISHPELKDKIIRPYNVWTHNSQVFAQKEDHGTHVAGIALAEADNGTGMAGIAPNARFMPVQVADNRNLMTITSILDGILYALYQGADVINVSLGGDFQGLDAVPEKEQLKLIDYFFKEEERLWREIMRIAVLHNSTIVVAAGNNNILAGIEALQRPESFITVSAVDEDNQDLAKADFSNYGSYSTISAPGIAIYSTYGNGYETMEGTSMAAPIVSGATALMKSLHPKITSRQIIQILQATGLPTQGHIGKLIQIDEALKMVQTGEVPAFIPSPSSGDVQILLGWDNYNDLDLICKDPNGDIIYYRNPTSASGGKLEIDMNVEYPGTKNPIENIFWKSGTAPKGRYEVYLQYYKQHERNIDETPYEIKVRYGNKTGEFKGKIRKEEEELSIGSFVY